MKDPRELMRAHENFLLIQTIASCPQTLLDEALQILHLTQMYLYAFSRADENSFA